VQAIVGVLKGVPVSDFNRTEMNKALENFSETVNQSIIFMEDFAHASSFDRFLKYTNHQQRFELLNDKLSQNARNLNLALDITLLFDRRQDVADQQEDFAEISLKLDEIAQAVSKQQQQSVDQHNEMKEELKRRLYSFRFHLQQDQLKAQNPDEAKKMNDEAKLFLQIPGHDLNREKSIGSGGFADVFRGTWISRHHRVAIKVIRINDLKDNIKQGFLNEIATMHKIRYDHVLGVFGACLEPNFHALIVEYMSLGSLFDVLQKKDRILSWPDRWSITLQMTKGINYLHMISILHRDIKSLNFLMETTINGYLVKVSDFGLAKIRQETSKPTVQAPGQYAPAGTLQWTAPELLKFDKPPSTASDVFSLGVVFWEVATGCVPYNELDNMNILIGVCAGNRLAIPDDVPSDFASIISNAWSQEPHKRPTCQQLIEMIKMAIPEMPTT